MPGYEAGGVAAWRRCYGRSNWLAAKICSRPAIPAPNCTCLRGRVDIPHPVTADRHKRLAVFGPAPCSEKSRSSTPARAPPKPRR